MTFIPLAIALAHTLEQSPGVTPGVRAAAVGAMALAALVGLPLRLVATGIQWQERSPKAIADCVRDNVRPGDVVVGDFKAYYALKKTAQQVYLPTYLDAISPDEESEVTVMILRPEDVSRAGKALADGNWIKSKGAAAGGSVRRNPLEPLCREFREEDYPLNVYRRKTGGGMVSRQ